MHQKILFKLTSQQLSIFPRPISNKEDGSVAKRMQIKALLHDLAEGGNLLYQVFEEVGWPKGLHHKTGSRAVSWTDGESKMHHLLQCNCYSLQVGAQNCIQLLMNDEWNDPVAFRPPSAASARFFHYGFIYFFPSNTSFFWLCGGGSEEDFAKEFNFLTQS